jgi:molybdate transport system substrate-binding protein
MRLHRLALLVLLLPLIVIAGCQKPAAQAPVPTVPAAASGGVATGELRIFIPCGMIVPMRAVGDAFMKKYPTIKVVGIFDNAGVIVNRIAKKGERGDLMVSPGSTEIGKLEAAGLVLPDTKKAVGDFELVCLVPASSTLKIEKPADLKQAKTMGSPDPNINSVGASGKEALTKLGLWDGLKPKMVFTEHAIQAYTLVAAGKADAAICYRNCPLETNPEKLSKSKVRIAFSFPKDSYTKQQCLIGQLRDVQNAAAAKIYLDYITSPEGLKILADNGMTGCLDLKQCPTPTAASPVASDAAVKVVAYYPGNEDHKKLRALIEGINKKYGGKVSGRFVDFTSDEGFKEWQAAGLSCGAILINGEQTYSYDKDGKPYEVTFKMREGGEWTAADLDAVINKLLKSKS